MEDVSTHADAQNRRNRRNRRNRWDRWDRWDRWVGAGVGLLFVGLALAIAMSSDAAAGGGVYAAAGMIGALGVDALVAAVRDRRSLLGRIGPLP